MNDREPRAQEAAHQADRGAEAASADAVEIVVVSYLDYLDGVGERPDLDQLAADDRRRAIAAINSMRTGRGIQLGDSTPSIEALLAGTDLEAAMVAAASGGDGQADGVGREAAARRQVDRKRARVEQIAATLGRTDSRITARVEPHGLLGPAVSAAFLDLHVVFVPVDGQEPDLTADALSVLRRVLSDDTDLDYIGVVADSADLLTQLVSAPDLGPVTATPSDGLPLPCPPVLPLPLAITLVLEQSAPRWEPFRARTDAQGPLQVGDLAAEAVRRVLARESARTYRGDKGLAYKSFAGAEESFTRLITRLAVPVTDAAVADAVDQITLDAA